MKCVFFAYCYLEDDCAEVMRQVEKFFSKLGWNLIISEKSMLGEMNKPMTVNMNKLNKCDLVLLEIGAVKESAAMIHEHAVNHGIEILYIQKKGTIPIETLSQYQHLAFVYETPLDLVGWLEGKLN